MGCRIAWTTIGEEAWIAMARSLLNASNEHAASLGRVFSRVRKRIAQVTAKHHILYSYYAILAVFLWNHRSAISELVDAWGRTETYQHGFLIVPAVLSIIWFRRQTLHVSDIRVEPSGLLLVAASLIIGTTGDVADIQVLEHLGLVLTIIGLTFSLLGRSVFARLSFPMFVLLFAVPAGDELVPPLIDVTASITVSGLNLFGIPVFREGPYLEVPGGRFEVARVCSGIRYLVASVAFATMFAGTALRTAKWRFIYVALAICVPVLANGLRALGIVLIAYYSDMRYAIGVDHILYGWIFFGLVIMILLLIGSRISERERNRVVLGDSQAGAARPVYQLNTYPVIILVTLGCLILSYPPTSVALLIPEKAVLAGLSPSLPNARPGWQGPEPAIPLVQSGQQGLNGVAGGVYAVTGGPDIKLFAFYYLDQAQGRELVNTENSLVASNHGQLIPEGHRELTLKYGHDLTVREAVFRQAGQRFKVLYWYDVAGVPTVSAIKAKRVQIVNGWRGLETPAALLLAVVQESSNTSVDLGHLTGFLGEHFQVISECLWAQREGMSNCAASHSVPTSRNDDAGQGRMNR